MLQQLKDDARWIIAGIVIIGIILKILFPLSSITEIAKLVAGVVWLFVIPGYCIMLAWRSEIELKERVVVGMLSAAGLFAVASYYFGIIGLPIKYHTMLFPILTIIVAVILLNIKRFMKRAQG
jgi:peptidoglycan/LPS O-acetylase OafA/YrhL